MGLYHRANPSPNADAVPRRRIVFSTRSVSLKNMEPPRTVTPVGQSGRASRRRIWSIAASRAANPCKHLCAVIETSRPSECFSSEVATSASVKFKGLSCSPLG